MAGFLFSNNPKTQNPVNITARSLNVFIVYYPLYNCFNELPAFCKTIYFYILIPKIFLNC